MFDELILLEVMMLNFEFDLWYDSVGVLIFEFVCEKIEI